MNQDNYSLGKIQEWAGHMVRNERGFGISTTPPRYLNRRECLEDNIISIEEIYFLSCKHPHYLCSECTPFSLQPEIISEIKTPFDMVKDKYRKSLEILASADEVEISTVGDVFKYCRELHTLADLAGKKKSLARDTLRYRQGGKCIIPACDKGRSLQMHRCLPGYLGGEYSEDNCVLVCAQHHPQLEQFRSKTEVMEYLSKEEECSTQ